MRIAKFKDRHDEKPYALKMLNKKEIIRLKQVDHVKMEKKVLNMLDHPFIINL